MFRSPAQDNFHKIIASHIAQHDAPLLLEGATGIGKTRAYLAAVLSAAAAGTRIAIVLPSHQLIEQLLASNDLAVTGREGVRVAAFRPRRGFDQVAEYRSQKQTALEAEVMVCTSGGRSSFHNWSNSFCRRA